MVRNVLRLTAAAVTAFGLCAALSAQIGWTARGFNNARTGSNQSESVLTQSNVNTGQFGLIFTRQVDGQIYAQPLVVPKVAIPNKGTFDVVYVATEHDSVFAFDADNPQNTAPLWQRSFIDPANGVTTIPYYYLTGEGDIHPEVGITSTPAIDTTTGTLYVVVATLEGDPKYNSSYVQRLWALDITTGAPKFGSPVVLSGNAAGTGMNNSNGVVSYDNMRNNQRPALVLNGNDIYIASASHGDSPPYHGWVLAYNKTTLQLAGAFCDTPNGSLGGIWMSGQAMPIDANGNMYLATGNGDFGVSQGNYGDTLLKLNPKTLSVLDYFTPYNQATLDQNDTDLGVCGPILIPGTTLAVQGSKEGKLYLVNYNNMGKFDSAGDNQITQWWWACNSLIYAPPVYWQGGSGANNLYVWSASDELKGFSFSGSTFNTTPFAAGGIYVDNPGGMLAVSSNGTNAASAVVWATAPYSGDANQNTVPGILHAFNASTLAEIWNSRMVVGDDYGNLAKFNPPAVVNGKVYVPTFSNQLAVYGELPHVAPQSVGLTAEAGDKEVALTWQSVHGVSKYAISRGPAGGPYTPLATVTGANSYYDDTGLTDGKTYAYRVVAMNAYGSSVESNEGSATPAKLSPPTTTNGLWGTYYNDAGNGNFFTTPTYKHLDPSIDFNWNGASPGGNVTGINFSAIWSGTLVAPTTGMYTFQTISDDGSRLWVSGAELTNGWVEQAPTSYNSAPTLLMAGKSYAIQVEYFQAPGGSEMELLWQTPGSNSFEIVPTTSLFSYSSVPLYDAGIDMGANATLDGMSYLNNPTAGDLGYFYESFASELMPRYSDFNLISSIPFIIGPGYEGALNITECDGQTITTPAYGANYAYVLGCAINGTQYGTFIFNYSDGTTTTQTVAFTDWGSAKPQNGELLAQNFKLRHNRTGNLNAATSIFRYQIPVTPSKRLISITLPTNSDIKIVALSLLR